MKKAAIYARKSTEQADVTRSVDVQVEECRKYCVQFPGWEIVHVFVDDGVSGQKEDREGLQSLLAVLPSTDIVVVEEQKALCRNTDLWGHLVYLFRKHSVDVHATMEGKSILPKEGDFEGYVVSAVRAGSDEKVTTDTSKRVKRTFMTKFKNGEVVGGRLYGYDNIPHWEDGTSGWENAKPGLNKTKTTREIDPRKAAIVRRIFELYANGVGLRGICKTLNAEGIPHPKTKQRKDGMVPHRSWSPSTVSGMLRREAYIGVFRYNKTQQSRRKGKKQIRRPEEEHLELAMPELRIVPQELWDKVQAHRQDMKHISVRIRQGRFAGRPPKDGVRNLMAGMLMCWCCRASMIVEKSPRKYGHKREYGCGNYHRTGGCANYIRVEAGLLHEAILQEVENHVLTPEAIEYVIGLSERDEVQEKRVLLERDRESIGKKIANLTKAISLGGEMVPLVEEMKRLNERQEKIELQLRELRPLQRIERKVVESHLEDWRRLLRGSIVQARAVLHKIIVGRIVMKPDIEQNGYQFEAQTRFDKLFQGMAVPVPDRLTGGNQGWEHLTAEDTGDSDKERLLAEKRLLGASPRGVEPLFER